VRWPWNIAPRRLLFVGFSEDEDQRRVEMFIEGRRVTLVYDIPDEDEDVSWDLSRVIVASSPPTKLDGVYQVENPDDEEEVMSSIFDW
jgi:hypothetical protein